MKNWPEKFFLNQFSKKFRFASALTFYALTSIILIQQEQLLRLFSHDTKTNEIKDPPHVSGIE